MTASHLEIAIDLFKSYTTHHHFGPFVDGYCSTVQGLLNCFEVDLGFTELLFIQIHVSKSHHDVGSTMYLFTSHNIQDILKPLTYITHLHYRQ